MRIFCTILSHDQLTGDIQFSLDPFWYADHVLVLDNNIGNIFYPVIGSYSSVTSSQLKTAVGLGFTNMLPVVVAAVVVVVAALMFPRRLSSTNLKLHCIALAEF